MKKWKNVVGFEGVYSISNFGKVRRDKGGKGIVVGKILKPHLHQNGYFYVSLYNNGFRKLAAIANLVAYAFIGERPKGYEINHKSGIKTDNNVNNLEYITPKENQRHAWNIGLHKPHGCKGEKSGRAKLTEIQVLKIRKMYSTGNFSCRKISKIFPVNFQSVNNIINRKSWTHI